MTYLYYSYGIVLIICLIDLLRLRHSNKDVGVIQGQVKIIVMIFILSPITIILALPCFIYDILVFLSRKVANV